MSTASPASDFNDELDVTRPLFGGYGDPHGAWVERERSVDVARRRQRRASGRDIEIYDQVDPQRRERLEADPEAWLRHYQRAVFYKPFSRDQRRIIERGFRCMVRGGLAHNVASRGTGKSSILRGLQLLGTLSGKLRFSPIVRSNYNEGKQALEMQKLTLQTSEELMADYPEACCPVRALGGVPQRARGMTWRGEELHFLWHPDFVRLPHLPGAACSGGAISATGVEGGRLRGISVQTATGEIMRPDMYLLDDLQDEESARSQLQVGQILEAIHKAILGGGGQGEKMAVLSAMTIIEEMDVADQLGRKELYPQWNAERQRMIYSMPENMKLWDEYEEIVLREIHENADVSDVQDVPAARAFYEQHREGMDAGAELCSDTLHLPRAWYAAKDAGREPEAHELPTCASALQYAMNLRIKLGPDAFEAEYNGQPPRHKESPLLVISPYMVMSRFTGVRRRLVPDGYTHICLGVDVGKESLHAVAVAFTEKGRRGHIVEYGEYVIDGAADIGDARHRDTKEYQALELAVHSSLTSLRNQLAARPYLDERGHPVPIRMAAVDSRFMGSAVNRFCDESGGKWMSLRGYKRQPRPSKTRAVTDYLYAEQHGRRWYWYHSADDHKRFVHEGFRIEPGHPGSLTLHGARASQHKEFAEHICAETYIEVGPGEFKWEPKKGVANHYLDACALAQACATRLQLSAFDSIGNDAPVPGADYTEPDDEEPPEPEAAPDPPRRPRPENDPPPQPKKRKKSRQPSGGGIRGVY